MRVDPAIGGRTDTAGGDDRARESTSPCPSPRNDGAGVSSAGALDAVTPLALRARRPRSSSAGRLPSSTRSPGRSRAWARRNHSQPGIDLPRGVERVRRLHPAFVGMQPTRRHVPPSSAPFFERTPRAHRAVPPGSLRCSRGTGAEDGDVEFHRAIVSSGSERAAHRDAVGAVLADPRESVLLLVVRDQQLVVALDGQTHCP